MPGFFDHPNPDTALKSSNTFTHHRIILFPAVLLYCPWVCRLQACTYPQNSISLLNLHGRCLLTNARFDLKLIIHWFGVALFLWSWEQPIWEDQWCFSWFGALKNQDWGSRAWWIYFEMRDVLSPQRNPQLMNCFVIKVAVIWKVSIAWTDIVITNKIILTNCSSIFYNQILLINTTLKDASFCISSYCKQS